MCGELWTPLQRCPVGTAQFGGRIFLHWLLLGLGHNCLVHFDIFIPFDSLLSTSKWLPLWIWLQTPQPGDLVGELQPLSCTGHMQWDGWAGLPLGWRWVLNGG